MIKDELVKEVEQLGINFMKELYGEGTYKQTSYNGNLRKNMARKGGTYDEGREAFIKPKPFSSWGLGGGPGEGGGGEGIAGGGGRKGEGRSYCNLG